jgi:hypothetical protein
MIEESLLKSNFVGKDGFIWWIGQVADPKVWRNEKTRIDEDNKAWGYRCKVRIVGYHSFSPNELPDKDLPWAHVLTSASDGAPGQGGFGKLPLLVGGESVVGFFLDGDEAQQPVVMACFHRSPAVVNVDNPNPFDAFTGAKGNLANGATRQKKPEEAQVKEVSKSIGSGSQFTMQSNPNFATDTTGSLDLDPGFVPLSSKTNNSAGSVWDIPSTLVTDKLFYDTAAELAFLNKFDTEEPVQNDNGCSQNIIGSITSTLQNFIKFVNGLEYTALGFIDPLRNKIVDISGQIRKVARLIASAMKFAINGMRDNIFQMVGCLFKGISAILPQPIKIQVSEATKNILNLIFCIFEKLFGPLWDFIQGLLEGLIGKTPNIPRCAAEETIAALISKLSEMVDGALATLLSGLDWLANGIGQVTGYIRTGLNTIAQIVSFLDCDALTCGPITSWDPFAGVNLPKNDNWQKILDNVDILGSYGESIDVAIGFLSLFGSSDTPFKDCRSSSTNPTTQEDAPPIPIGTRYYKCIAPDVVISGDGIDAKAKAVVSSIDGSILTIQILNAGKGFTEAPTIHIIDKTRYGKGATAKASINANGNIESIVITEKGSGYCATDLNEIITGLGITTGIGTTSTGVQEEIVTNNLGISTVPVGIVTSIFIDRPGIGYTNGDLITVGNCTYSPIVSSSGGIIKVMSSNCLEEFDTYPEVTINTRTGQGAILYPVINYLPQFVTDNQFIKNTRVGIGTTIVNVVQCV